MQTFKLIGSGPCSNQIYYCSFGGYDSCGDVILDTDDWYSLGSRGGDRLTVNSETGMLKVKGVETDLFRIDPLDLPRFQKFQVLINQAA